MCIYMMKVGGTKEVGSSPFELSLSKGEEHRTNFPSAVVLAMAEALPAAVFFKRP